MKEFLRMLSNAKPVTSTSLSHYQQENWKNVIKEYLGKTAIYINNSKKDVPRLVEIKEIYDNTVLLEVTNSYK